MNIKAPIEEVNFRELRQQTCEVCGKIGPDVNKVVDEFQAEMYGNIVKRNLCDKCHNELTDEI